MNTEISIEHFLSWLCEKERQIVGLPGIWFNDPLSEWLTSVFGRLYGVHNRMYGPAQVDECQWRWLPYWAVLFVLWTECYAFNHEMSGADAVSLLSEIEKRHTDLWRR